MTDSACQLRKSPVRTNVSLETADPMSPPSPPVELPYMRCASATKADGSPRAERSPHRDASAPTFRPSGRRGPPRGVTPAARNGTSTAASRLRASDSSVGTPRPLPRPPCTDVVLRCRHRRHRTLADRQTALARPVTRPPRRRRRGCRLHPPSCAGVRPAAPALVPRCAQCPIGWTHRHLRQLPDGGSSLSARCGSSTFTTRRVMPMHVGSVRGLRPNVAAEPRAPTSPTFTPGDEHGKSRRIPDDPWDQCSRSSWTTAWSSPRRALCGASVRSETGRRIGTRDRPPASQLCRHSLETAGTLACGAFAAPDPSRSQRWRAEARHLRNRSRLGDGRRVVTSVTKTHKVADRNLPKALPVSDARAVQAPPHDRPIRNERYANARSSHRVPTCVRVSPRARRSPGATPRDGTRNTPLGPLRGLPGTSERSERGASRSHTGEPMCANH